MKKNRTSASNDAANSRTKIPDVEIIDLDNNMLENNYDDAPENNPGDVPPEDNTGNSSQNRSNRSIFARYHLHTAMHLALLAVFVALIGIVVYRIANLRHFISQEEFFSDGAGVYEPETYDVIVPLVDSEGMPAATKNTKDSTILFLGNYPLTDAQDSEDGLVNMIAERTGANVINCGVSGSYTATIREHFRADSKPMDAYTPYWLCVLTVTDVIDFYFEDGLKQMGEDAPPEAERVYKTLSTIDMNTVDTVVFMYDGTDYLMGSNIYNSDNPIDLQTFTGNIEASIEVLQNAYPHLRIIVMSPAYAYGIDNDGNLVSSDKKIYGGGMSGHLSSYCLSLCMSCSERNVTFVDNLYGTITEDDAPECLEENDNIHLNSRGRELMADRLIYALTYYDDP